MKKLYCLAFKIFLVILFLSASKRDAIGELERMTIAYGGISGQFGPLWVTKEYRIFEKYGLKADMIYISAAKAAQAMLAGEIPIASSTAAIVVNSGLAGADMVLIAGVVNIIPYVLMTTKEITKAEQLKGKKIAISRFGSATDFITRYALERLGLIPDRDVAIIQIGEQTERFAAMQIGAVHGTLIFPPLTLSARKLGFNTIVDLSTANIEYVAHSFASTKSVIKRRPESVRKFIKALIDGIHYFKTHKKESMGVISKYMRLNDMEAVEEGYNYFTRVVSSKPYPTMKGVQLTIDEIAKKNPKAKSAKPEDFIDSSFIKELDTSGFIDNLYK